MTATSAGPDEGAAALGQYLGAIRARTRVVVLVTLATVAVAAAFLATRAATYKSTAELLVAPLPQDSPTYLPTVLLRDSGDPTRTVQTAAALVASPLAAQDTARRLGGGLTSGDVQQNINVQPLGDSDILSVTASATSPAAATRLADQYVRSTLAVRARQLQRQVDAAIAAIGPTPAASDAATLAALRSVRNVGDPTLTLAQPAQTAQAATGAPAPLVLVLAAIAGFTLGSIAALLMERFDYRVRDAGELLALAPIPIVLRVPTTGRNGRRASRDGVAWSVREAFRTMQIELDQRRVEAGGASQTVMVTSASSADGKTSTALSLAFALVGAGHRVILMDCDLRKPDIAPRLGLEPSDSLVALVSSRVALIEVLQPARPNLQVLAAARGSRDNTLLRELGQRIGDILEEALELADYVVIDSAPLGEVGDPLTIAGHVDALLLVVRPQHTNRKALQTTVELLERAHTTPAGWVVIGDEGMKRYPADAPASAAPTLAHAAAVTNKLTRLRTWFAGAGAAPAGPHITEEARVPAASTATWPQQSPKASEQSTAEPPAGRPAPWAPPRSTAPEPIATELSADRDLSPEGDHTPTRAQEVAELREQVIELLEHDEQEHRSSAPLAEHGNPDDRSVEAGAVNRLLASEEQAILDLIAKWAPLDRSYRKLAYRGSYTGSVFVSPSTLQRVALKHRITVPGEPPRPPRRKLAFPEVPWEPNRIWMWEASLFPAAGRVAYAIVDVVTRYWIAYLLASEQVPVQLLFALAREEQGLHNGGGTPGSDSGPILVAWSEDGAEMIADGTPTATAYMESFFGLLKGEWPRLTLPSDPDALDQELARVRDEYNTVRLHAGVGYVTPSDAHNGRGLQIRRARDDGLRRARAERIKQNRMLDQ